MSDNIVVSASPHLKDFKETSKIMWIVVASLLPTAVASVFIFGFQSLAVITVSVATCVLTEIVSQLIFKKPITVSDGSAVVTGLLFAFVLPAGLGKLNMIWMVVVGAFAAIFLVKQLFGGLGFNIFNPALAARALLLSSFPVAMTTWMKPLFSGADVAREGITAASGIFADATTSASILGMIKEGAPGAGSYSQMDMLFGFIPGSLGETCKITLLAGGAILLLLRIVDWRIPFPFIVTVAGLSWAFGRDPLTAVLTGGVILGAFFMATDMVTSPVTRIGKVIFGMGCGLITVLIRSYGGFPEGVCYSILLMNCVVPLLDKALRPRVFGAKSMAKKSV